jgi:hypothetical protein
MLIGDALATAVRPERSGVHCRSRESVIASISSLHQHAHLKHDTVRASHALAQTVPASIELAAHMWSTVAQSDGRKRVPRVTTRSPAPKCDTSARSDRTCGHHAGGPALCDPAAARARVSVGEAGGVTSTSRIPPKTETSGGCSRFAARLPTTPRSRRPQCAAARILLRCGRLGPRQWAQAVGGASGRGRGHCMQLRATGG